MAEAATPLERLEIAVQPRRSRRAIPWARIVLGIFSALVLLYLVAPVLIVIPMSFSAAKYLSFPPPGLSLQWYENFFARSDWTSATIQSIRVAFMVMVLSTVLGVAASLALVRASFPGKEIVNLIIVSPLVVPAIIVAIAIYGLYVQLRLVQTFWGLVLAHTVLAIPYVIVNVSATLRGFDIRLEQAAQSLGANGWQTFRHVTLPLISPGIFAGAVFAFIASFDELIVALFIAGARGRTLPMRMFEGLRMEIDPTIAAVSSMLITFSVLVLASAELVRRRSQVE
ncbi:MULTISPECIES: ABC transporter permease [Thermomicrobium]|jgi:putative spermidine/putrescine transport system permease protein|uniref:Putative ABC transporter, permease protein n=1 Tax=Thermomicrobium roseum (strain ATCC 27502 / DSM 5159 / P-2) TaxID=309801 RepID=B9KZF6_THERP|nr:MULTISPECIES: ABC transporter permease [Thermomicrobium]ACM04874.1 putative ABC transporter, permease protein [Thermomicrobium roseum DSM 5159]MBO9305909.1 ABC transporter permease [Thermomicrobium sp.]MBO9358707.1 ABC transporter permease [Thermomicrobium sp.]MBO9385858.1 ABC transporter permease [Thermomicrobium sp.]MBO9403492.1 ABC transporter permease [Thermomicrobium sp.]